jgi:RNA polymerase sigma factor (sigma-70 family)
MNSHADWTGRGAAAFRTTHWTAVMNAGGRDAPAAQDALAELCQTYWYPLYAYIRRSGRSPEDAEDLTQGFFARLLEKNFFEGLTRDGGKFRSFLLVALKRFVANEWERAQAQKRGGGKVFLSLDEEAENRYKLEPVDDMSPERLFERGWAFTLLDQVVRSLESEFEKKGRQQLFRELRPFLVGGDTGDYQGIGSRLGITENAVKVAVHRLRKRYGKLLRDEIARTVATPEEVQEEIGHLISISIASGYSFSRPNDPI